MKATTSFLLLITPFQFAAAQNAKPAKAYTSVRYDGIYECKEWKMQDEQPGNPAPAYYRFYPDSVLLLCQNKDTRDRDSVSTLHDIFSFVLAQPVLDKIRENMDDDPSNVYRVVGKFKVTAYRYKKIQGGICFDLLSERTNCLGKPNMKILGDDMIKALSQSGDPVDDRVFKFVPVN